MGKEKKDIRIYPWGHERRFNAYSNYFRSLFGARVQKGSVEIRIYLSQHGLQQGQGGLPSVIMKLSPHLDAPRLKTKSQQIGEGIEIHSGGNREAATYLAYFPGPMQIHILIQPAQDFIRKRLDIRSQGIVIGTRPDCIDAEKLDYIQSLAGSTMLPLNADIESVYDKTLKD
jgi:radical SAM superfamily enzyme